MNSPTAFPRYARLLKPAQYAHALKGRRVARGLLFSLQVSTTDEPETARLGMVIGKRHAPLAVSRAAIKRVIREAFRHQRSALPAADYLVRLHSRVPGLSLTALKRQTRTEIDGHLLRACRLRPRTGTTPRDGK